MRLSCSGVLFPLSIRGRTALLLAIVLCHLLLRKPIQGNSFCSFRSLARFSPTLETPVTLLSPPRRCHIYSRLLNTWNYISLPNGAFVRKYFRGKDLEENFFSFFFFRLQRKCNYSYSCLISFVRYFLIIVRSTKFRKIISPIFRVELNLHS